MKIKTRFLTIFGLLMAFYGCGEETAGEKAEFKTQIYSSVSEGGTVKEFTNSKGWKIKLKQAYAAIGPIYFYDAEPYALTLFRRLFDSSKAYACATHAQFDRGAVLGEITKQYAVDLLSKTPTDAGESQGEAGRCRMFEIHLHTPGHLEAGSGAAEFENLQGATVFLKGTAEKSGEIRSFEARLTIPDSGTMRIVESIPADVEIADKSKNKGALSTVILLDKWFINVDFSSLSSPQGAGGIYEIEENSQAHTALITALRSRYSYRLEWRE